MVLGLIHRQSLDYRHNIDVMLEDLIAHVFRLENLPISLFSLGNFTVGGGVFGNEGFFFTIIFDLVMNSDIFICTV